MKTLFACLTLVCLTHAAHAAAPFTVSGSDGRMLTKILKLAGVAATHPAPGLTQYSIAETDCTMGNDQNLPSFHCTTKSSAAGLSQEIGATTLYEALMESGVTVSSARAISLVSVVCTLAVPGDSSCIVTDALAATPIPVVAPVLTVPPPETPVVTPVTPGPTAPGPVSPTTLGPVTTTAPAPVTTTAPPTVLGPVAPTTPGPITTTAPVPVTVLGPITQPAPAPATSVTSTAGTI